MSKPENFDYKKCLGCESTDCGAYQMSVSTKDAIDYLTVKQGLKLARSINTLIEHTARIQASRTERETIFAGDCDDRIDELRDRFADKTEGLPFPLPTIEEIRDVGSDVVMFDRRRLCMQYPKQE
ncbi:MAG TPA: hypothetical protein VMQ58_03275 [Candidatus Saccharimonadales bacterium]|jgi:hypothetical protein|nr:hypothetical protein [Candidatus Saccharimonadales bacterium]